MQNGGRYRPAGRRILLNRDCLYQDLARSEHRKTTWTKTYRLLYSKVCGKSNKAEVLLGKEVKPGEQIDISVVFLAPQTNGTQTGYWKLYNDQGYIFGEVLSMKVVVTDNPDAFKTPTPTK